MRVTIHIGGGKTGTSAIQRSLAHNRDALATQGTYVAPSDLRVDGPVTGYQVFRFEELRALGPEAGRTEFKDSMHALAEHAVAAGNNHMVLSAENLSNDNSWNETVAAGLSDFDVTAVIYVRRQDKYLLSAWQQWGLKTGTTFDEWLIQRMDTAADWRKPIQSWTELATNRQMQVRIFEPGRLLNGDVVEDFYDVIGADTAELTLQHTPVNESYSIAAEELAVAASGLFSSPHDNDFYKFLDNVATEGHRKRGDESRLTHRERRLIVNRYGPCNRWIKEHFFAHDDTVPEALFAHPTLAESRVLSNDEKLQRTIGLLTELVYGVHQGQLRK